MKKIAILIVFLFIIFVINCQNTTTDENSDNQNAKDNSSIHDHTNSSIINKTENQNSTLSFLSNDSNLPNSEQSEAEGQTIQSIDDDVLNQYNSEVWEKLYNQEIEDEEEQNQELIRNSENLDKTENKEIKEKKEYEERKTVDQESKTEWEKNLSDFEPAEMLTFEIEEDEKELIFDPISEVPSHIKVVYLVNDESTSLDFEIIDPKQNLIYSQFDKAHLYYEFNATIPGEYIFSLDNKKNSGATKLTFAIHQGLSTNTNLSHEHTKKLYEKMKAVKREAKKSQFISRLLSKKYDAHYENTKKHNRNIIMFSLVETAIMILVFFFQLCYIKRLASKIY